MISTSIVKTLTGEELYYHWYLRDMLLLINYTEHCIYDDFRGSSSLINVFRPYFKDSEWHVANGYTTKQLLTFAMMYLYSFYKGYVDADIGQLPFMDAYGNNSIRLVRVRPQIIHRTIKGIHRPLSRIGWFGADHNPSWTSLSPSSLGLKAGDSDTALPIFVQQHAIIRFEERTMLPQGLVFAYFAGLTGKRISIQRSGQKILVAFFIAAHKIGYFVVSLDKDILVVHTFLFLTNDGTPEGKKLAELTQLQLLDKQ